MIMKTMGTRRARKFLWKPSLIGSGKPKIALRLFDPECKTHNQYTPGDMKEFNALRILGFFNSQSKM
jgi:hypothetical protein